MTQPKGGKTQRNNNEIVRMKNRKEIWYSLKYFSLQSISLNTVLKAVTTNLNICWIIWSASAAGLTAEGGQKALPSVTRLDSGEFGAPPVTLQKICGRDIREKVQPEIEDWDPGTAETESMTPDSVFRMCQSPRESPQWSTHRGRSLRRAGPLSAARGEVRPRGAGWLTLYPASRLLQLRREVHEACTKYFM